MAAAKNIHIPANEKMIIYLVVIYIIGIVGMLVEATTQIFIFLVPLNIISALAIVFLYHKAWNNRFIIAICATYGGGFLLEWLGIKTGIIFGNYQYGEGLGPKIDQVPIIMGLNWLLLVYGATAISSRFFNKTYLIAALGATLMVIYDLFLEPSAILYNFWNWPGDRAPLQNYLAWWVSAFVFISFFMAITKIQPKNRVAEAIFWLQIAFFICLYLCNKFII